MNRMINEEKVYSLIEQYHLNCGCEARYIDLVSETGELGKELLKGSDYGKAPFQITSDTKEEMGDCLFSLIALCHELGIDPGSVLDQAISKYERRFGEKGDIGSGK